MPSGLPPEESVDAENGPDENDVEHRIAETDHRGQQPLVGVVGRRLDDEGESRGQHHQDHGDPVQPAVEFESPGRGTGSGTRCPRP